MFNFKDLAKFSNTLDATMLLQQINDALKIASSDDSDGRIELSFTPVTDHSAIGSITKRDSLRNLLDMLEPLKTLAGITVKPDQIDALLQYGCIQTLGNILSLLNAPELVALPQITMELEAYTNLTLAQIYLHRPDLAPPAETRLTQQLMRLLKRPYDPELPYMQSSAMLALLHIAESDTGCRQIIAANGVSTLTSLLDISTPLPQALTVTNPLLSQFMRLSIHDSDDTPAAAVSAAGKRKRESAAAQAEAPPTIALEMLDARTVAAQILTATARSLAQQVTLATRRGIIADATLVEALIDLAGAKNIETQTIITPALAYLLRSPGGLQAVLTYRGANPADLSLAEEITMGHGPRSCRLFRAMGMLLETPTPNTQNCAATILYQIITVANGLQVIENAGVSQTQLLNYAITALKRPLTNEAIPIELMKALLHNPRLTLDTLRNCTAALLNHLVYSTHSYNDSAVSKLLTLISQSSDAGRTAIIEQDGARKLILHLGWLPTTPTPFDSELPPPPCKITSLRSELADMNIIKILFNIAQQPTGCQAIADANGTQGLIGIFRHIEGYQYKELILGILSKLSTLPVALAAIKATDSFLDAISSIPESLPLARRYARLILDNIARATPPDVALSFHQASGGSATGPAPGAPAL